jgi:hypothetical protein
MSAAAYAEDLWIMCSGTDYDRKELVNRLLRLNGRNGDIQFDVGLDFDISLPAHQFPGDRLLAAGDGVAAILTDIQANNGFPRGGVYLTRVADDGKIGPPVRVVPVGSQLQQVVPTHDGNLLIVADQSPLSIRKVTFDGVQRWERILPTDLVLGQVAVFADDSLCFTAQRSRRADVQLYRLDSAGRIRLQATLAASQAAVAAGSDGVCVVLKGSGFGAAAVSISAFDNRSKHLWTKSAPFDGRGGRDYQIETVADGFLGLGRGLGDGDTKVLARFSKTGETREMMPFPSDTDRFVLTAAGGYFLGNTLGRATGGYLLRVTKVRWR